MKLFSLSVSMLILSAVFAGISAADEVVLTNGDAIHGDIVSLADGKLVLKTVYAGDVTINWAEVKSVSTASSIAVETKDGIRLSAVLIKSDKGVVVSPVEEGVNGNLILTPNGIAYLGKAAEDEAATQRMLAAANPTAFALMAKWSGNLDLSYTEHRGNSEDTVLSIKAKFKKESKRDRFTIEGAYDYAEALGARTVTKGALALRYDYNVTDRMFTWLQLMEEHDYFADVDLRSTAGGGIGGKLIDKSTLKLEFRTGLTYVDTNNIDPVPDTNSAGTLAGINLGWDIAKGLTFSQVVEWQYGFDEGDHRIHAASTLRRMLNKNLSMTLSFIDDFNDSPAPGKKKEDVTLFAGLGFSF